MGYWCDYLLSCLIQSNRRLGALLIFKFNLLCFPKVKRADLRLFIYFIFLCIFSAFHFPCLQIPFPYIHHIIKTHFHSFFMDICNICIKRPLHSFLLFFLTLCFSVSVFCFYIWPLCFGFFQSHALYCRVPLHSVEHFTLPTFSAQFFQLLSPFLFLPLYLFLSCDAPVICPLWISSFLIIFSLSVLFFFFFFFLSWSAAFSSSLLYISEKAHFLRL